MFMSWLKYRLMLAKLQRKRRKVLSAYRNDYKEARTRGENGEKLDELMWVERQEVGMIDDDVESVTTQFLLETSRRLLLPIPEYQEEGGAWTRSSYTDELLLTRLAMVELRAAIREEKSARREGAMTWMAAATGIIGALTGLIAVWRN